MKPESVAEGIRRLEDSLRHAARTDPSRGLAIAFSGGLDSRFLAHMTARAGIPVHLLHVRGPHIPRHEHLYALDWAARNAFSCTVIDLDPLAIPALRNNPEDRCYHCKKNIFATLRTAAAGRPLLDGTNASDRGEYRPGLTALAELAVISPLAEAVFHKADIRAAAAATGMERPNQTAQPCLLTRFPYGADLDGETLRAVDTGEDAVRTALTRTEYPDTAFRLRYETPERAALHVAMPLVPEPIARVLTEALAGAGFPDIPIRPMPGLSGFFDRAR